MNLNFCKKCLFPDTKPDLFFDEEGVCDACRSAEQKWERVGSIDWKSRSENFDSIIRELSGNALYDCVVAVSGGKDSCWQAYAAKQIHGLKVLAVTFDQFDQTPVGEKNLKFLQGLGVDHCHFTLNPSVVKNLVYKGFREIGDPYWVNHVGIFTIPHRIATGFGIPLILYGENPQFEYGGPEKSRKPQLMDKRWRQEFAGLRGLREEDMVDEIISERDMSILEFPEPRAGESQPRGIFYGDYFRWDPKTHTEFLISIGWTPLSEPPKGSYSDRENCDMQFIDIREHIKFLKFGYGRASDQLNMEIRSGEMKREDALKLVKRIDGKVSEKNIKNFCTYIEISRSEFDAIIDDFVNKELFEKTQDGWIPKFQRK